MPAVNIRDEGRVQRLISLAYFLSTRSEIHIDELVERLGVTRTQVEADLNVLMYCGLPPYSPEQLFDIIIEDDFVSMYFNDVFIAPLRLTEEEKAHIVIALARLESQSTDTNERETINEVATLIDAAHSDVMVVVAPPSTHDNLLREAIAARQPVSIKYLSLSSAKITERIIEPQALYTTASITYAFAYSPEAHDFRVFRTDRILEAQLRDDIESQMDERNNVTNDLSEQVKENQLFIDSVESYVDLDIDDLASWILDSFPHENSESKSGIYRFYTPSAFFAARLILANQPYVSYVGGSFSQEAILNALNTLRNQMHNTAEKS